MGHSIRVVERSLGDGRKARWRRNSARQPGGTFMQCAIFPKAMCSWPRTLPWSPNDGLHHAISKSCKGCAGSGCRAGGHDMVAFEMNGPAHIRYANIRAAAGSVQSVLAQSPPVVVFPSSHAVSMSVIRALQDGVPILAVDFKPQAAGLYSRCCAGARPLSRRRAVRRADARAWRKVSPAGAVLGG